MKLLITNLAIKVILNKNSTDKEKNKALVSMLGKNYTDVQLNEVIGAEGFSSFREGRKKFLDKLEASIVSGAPFSHNVEIEVTATPLNKKLSWYKRFARLFVKNAFQRELDAINNENSNWNNMINNTRALIAKMNEKDIPIPKKERIQINSKELSKATNKEGFLDNVLEADIAADFAAIDKNKVGSSQYSESKEKEELDEIAADFAALDKNKVGSSHYSESKEKEELDEIAADFAALDKNRINTAQSTKSVENEQKANSNPLEEKESGHSEENKELENERENQSKENDISKKIDEFEKLEVNHQNQTFEMNRHASVSEILKNDSNNIEAIDNGPSKNNQEEKNSTVNASKEQEKETVQKDNSTHENNSSSSENLNQINENSDTINNQENNVENINKKAEDTNIFDNEDIDNSMKNNISSSSANLNQINENSIINNQEKKENNINKKEENSFILFANDDSDIEKKDANKSVILSPEEMEAQIAEMQRIENMKKSEELAKKLTDNTPPSNVINEDEDEEIKRQMEQFEQLERDEAAARKLNEELNPNNQFGMQRSVPYINNYSVNALKDVVVHLTAYKHLAGYRNYVSSMGEVELENFVETFAPSIPNLTERLNAFNYRSIRKDESLADYHAYLSNRTTGLKPDNDTSELIALASFNKAELNATLDFVKGKPDLQYLVKPLQYKIGVLSSARMVNTTRNDNPIRAREYESFTYANSTSPIQTIAQNVVWNQSTVKRFNQKDTDANLRIIEKAMTKKHKPIVVTKDKDSLFINLGPALQQNSGNGCWSCSLHELLKFQGVELDQKVIRDFRPSCDTSMIPNDTSLVQLKNRFVFAVRNSFDIVNAVFDYTELIHKAVDNAAVHQLTLSKDVPNTIKGLLDKYQTPISITNGGHYTTIIGYDGDNYLYLNSNDKDPLASQKDNPLVLKYGCNVGKLSNIRPGFEIVWIEKNPNTLDYKNYDCTIPSVNGKTIELTDSKNELAHSISISKEMAMNLQIGPYAKQNVEIPMEDKDSSNAMENEINENTAPQKDKGCIVS